MRASWGPSRASGSVMVLATAAVNAERSCIGRWGAGRRRKHELQADLAQCSLGARPLPLRDRLVSPQSSSAPTQPAARLPPRLPLRQHPLPARPARLPPPRAAQPAGRPATSMAAKATPCKDALAKWAAAAGVAPEAAERVELIGVCPPIEKMDSSLGTLKACRHLALSTNALDKIGNLAGLEALETLSLGRNCLKNLSGLEAVGGTLQQLWISYNQVDRLVRGAGGMGAGQGVGWPAMRVLAWVPLPLVARPPACRSAHHLHRPGLHPAPLLQAAAAPHHGLPHSCHLRQTLPLFNGACRRASRSARACACCTRPTTASRTGARWSAWAACRSWRTCCWWATRCITSGGTAAAWRSTAWRWVLGSGLGLGRWVLAPSRLLGAGRQRAAGGFHRCKSRSTPGYLLLPPPAQVLKRVPTLKKLDGQPVDVEEREAAQKK